MQNTTTAVEVRVPGSSLPLYTDGKRLVALKPIAEYFGLDWAGQFTKLKSKSWATIGKFSTVASDGKTREMTSGDRRTLTMWLATLDENRVRADKRDELIAYSGLVMAGRGSVWLGMAGRARRGTVWLGAAGLGRQG